MRMLLGATVAPLILMTGCISWHSYPKDMTAVNSLGKTCVVLKPENESKPELSITSSGSYCLLHDYKGCHISPLAWERSGCSGAVLEIEANDVDVDLMQHALIAQGTAILGIGKNITIRNGQLDGYVAMGNGNKRVDSIGPNYRILDDSQRRTIDNIPAGVNLKEWLAGNPEATEQVAYIDRSVRIQHTGNGFDNIEFHATKRGLIRMTGANNFIRNSTFHATLKNEFKSDGTPLQILDTHPSILVTLYGPNALFENNKINQTTKNGNGKVSSYSIYLQDADNSIIRSNTISIGGHTKNTIGIGLRMSNRVIIENNNIINAETPVQTMEESSSEQKNNSFSTSRFNKFKVK